MDNKSAFRDVLRPSQMCTSETSLETAHAPSQVRKRVRDSVQVTDGSLATAATSRDALLLPYSDITKKNHRASFPTGYLSITALI